jgi:hypothetical protein
LVLVLAIAGATSRPPRLDDDGLRTFGTLPSTSLSPSTQSAKAPGSEPTTPMALVRAAGWQ